MTWNELIPVIEQAADEIWKMMQQPAYALYGEILQQRLAVMLFRLQEAKIRAEIEEGEIHNA